MGVFDFSEKSKTPDDEGRRFIRQIELEISGDFSE